MHEPVGVQFGGELLFPSQNFRPSKKRAWRPALNGDQALVEPSIDRGQRVVGRAVVDEINLNPLINQVADNLSNNIALIVRRDHGDDPEVWHGPYRWTA